MKIIFTDEKESYIVQPHFTGCKSAAALLLTRYKKITSQDFFYIYMLYIVYTAKEGKASYKTFN